jgi:hypothetical protein
MARREGRIQDCGIREARERLRQASYLAQFAERVILRSG